MTQTEFAEHAAALDRDSPTPLWAQLEAELRRRLDARHFDRRFPTDRELMDIYAVSRHTARHAIGQLGADGIVRRARGIGTSLDRRTLARSLGTLYNIQQQVDEAVEVQHNTVVELALVTDEAAADALGLPDDSELVHLHRVNYGDDLPMAVDRVWMPASLAAPLLTVDFSRITLYEGLDATFGRRPNAGWERIWPSIPSADDRAALGLGHDDAVFTLSRLGTLDGQPFEWRITQVRGDRFAIAGEWSTGQRGELRMQLLPLE
jgi:GntR family transcriptional regulator